jgi:GTP cyclohydrolase II
MTLSDQKMTLSEYQILDKVLDVKLQNKDGRNFMMGSYKTSHNDVTAEHGLIYKGDIINPKEPILFRINSACYTSDIFGCQRCDCHWQLTKAMDLIHEKGGLIIYHFHHEGRGFGFTSKLKSLHSLSPTEVILKLHNELDHRRYYSAVKILNDLGIKKIKLITNNPAKRQILESQNIEVVKQIPLVTNQKHLRSYLITKKEKLGNIINFDDE